ncbi:hypothetical protein Aperf_G00000015880 [Anoplocephala perfoliata]
MSGDFKCPHLNPIFRIANLHGLEEFLVVVGSLPDQAGHLLEEYLEVTEVSNPHLLINFVSFDCRDVRVLEILEKLTRINPAKFSLHVYSSLNEDSIWTGDDMLTLRHELTEAKKIAKEVQRLRSEFENDGKINLNESLRNPWAEQKDEDILEFHENGISLGTSFRPETSKMWLSRHGLKAKGLDFYQICLLEKRLSWLKLPIHRHFGTLVEESVIIILDQSMYNFHVQSSLQSFVKQFMENQINKVAKFFNVIVIGEAVEPFEREMVAVTKENLQRAWKWLRERGSTGTRNVMEALRIVDNILQDCMANNVGLYLLTTGNPDQNLDQLTDFLEIMKAKKDVTLHVSLYSTVAPENSGSNYPVNEELLGSILTWFMTATSCNGLLNRGSMFVFSSDLFRKLLDVDQCWKAERLLDLGAGDGRVTQRMAPMFDEVYVTEISPVMRWRLRQANFTVLEIDEWDKTLPVTTSRTDVIEVESGSSTPEYDVVACLNLLDRCAEPLTLLRRMRAVLKPVSGRIVIALVLPLSQYVETTPKNEPLEVMELGESREWEVQFDSFVANVLEPAGLELVRWTRVPYLCEGDLARSFYSLNDVVMVVKSANVTGEDTSAPAS